MASYKAKTLATSFGELCKLNNFQPYEQYELIWVTDEYVFIAWHTCWIMWPDLIKVETCAGTYIMSMTLAHVL